ncbi:MAG: lipoate--protein ligase [Eubacteriaceae bacterium]
MLFYYNQSTDPFYNLALEEYLFSDFNLPDTFFMLWQNANTIVIGRNQNVIEEINTNFVNEMKTSVVRRNTGGGAVYHDLGNINFTFIQNCALGQSLDFSYFSKPIIHALTKFGIHPESTGRNDLTIEGYKFSGAAQTIKKGRMLHHGTLLFNSDLDFIEKALTVNPDKIISKGIKSVRSRVANISDFLPKQLSVDLFRDQLMSSIIEKNSPSPLQLSSEDLQKIEHLRKTKYATWEWNYGTTPKYDIQKYRRFPSGSVNVSMSVSRQGSISHLSIRGDFFGKLDVEDLESLLIGISLKETDLLKALSCFNISDYISDITPCEFVEMLLY